jgi:hypothetical protein
MNKDGAKLQVDELTLKQLLNNLKITPQIVIAGGSEGINEIKQKIFQEAYNLCPISDGYLRESMYEDMEILADVINANVGHGGSNNKYNVKSGKWTDDYAVEVHEISKQHDGGTTWKWLEKAVNSLGVDFEFILGKYLEASLNGNITQARSILSSVFNQVVSNNKKK